MTLSLSEVQLGKSINQLINVPWEIYKEDPNWVPPLKISVKDLFSPKHPFFETSVIKCWVAKKGHKAVGRIVAIINRAHIEHSEKNVVFSVSLITLMIQK